MTHDDDATRTRFAATAALLASHGAERVEALRRRVSQFVEPSGRERVLDVGTGTGTLALAFAPLVAEVVALDLVPEMLDQLRQSVDQAPNVSIVEGDAHHLPLEDASFDLVASARTIHHVSSPETVFAEITRVTRAGGRILILDQIASADPRDALAQNRLEQLRDPSHFRVLPDGDFRALFEMNSLVLLRFDVEREDIDLDEFLDLAGCAGAARAAVLAEVERLLGSRQTAGIDLRQKGEGYALTLSVAWYLLAKPEPPVSTW